MLIIKSSLHSKISLLNKYMNTDNIQAQFNAVSEQYDRQRQALIPCFHDFYGMAVRLARQAGNVRHILDLGAGTGLMSAMLLPAFPNARFTLADVSAHMLDKARQRFAGRPQFDFLECAFADLDLPPQSVDLAVSGLAIHHLDDEGKQQLFRRVFQWLKPNGWLINADQVLGENAAAEALYTAAWREHVLADTFLDDAAKAAAFERIKLDKMATWHAQEAWLKQAGFPQPAVYYQYYNFIVFAAQKP